MDFEVARTNMVESQIRTWDVLDQRILDVLLDLRREEFVPEAFRQLAFGDLDLPLGHGQFMLSPKLEARLVQELGVGPADHVLEVGTGSGFTTALLCRLAAQVHSVDVIPELSRAAAAGSRPKASAMPRSRSAMRQRDGRVMRLTMPS